MKKLLSCVLVLAFAVSMTACNVSVSTGSPNQPDSSSSQSGSKSESDSSSSQSGDASDSNSSGSSDSESSSSNGSGSKFMTPTEYKDFLKDYINTDHYRESSIDEDSLILGLNDEYYKDPQLPSNRDIKVNNDTTVTVGMKYQKLIDQGWSFDDDSYKTKEFPANAMGMGPQMTKNGKKIKTDARNVESSPVKFPDVSVDGITVILYESEYNYRDKSKTAVDFSLDGKIDNNMNMKSLIDTLGEPKTVHYRKSADNIDVEEIRKSSVELEYYDSGLRYTFAFSSDGSKMISFVVIKIGG